jgi:hypothetical protein
MVVTRACVILVLAVILTAGALTPANAAPSLFGYTGLLVVPSADALDEKDWNVGYWTLNVEEGADEKIFVANLGVGEGTEVGFARVNPDMGPNDTVLSGKYRFQPEDWHKPALAAGVFDVTDEMDTTVYLVASKMLNPVGEGGPLQPRVHVGIGGGVLDGLFGGVSAVMGDRLTVIAEYDSNDVNFGGRLAVGGGVRVHAGWINDLDDIAIGASYNRAY